MIQYAKSRIFVLSAILLALLFLSGCGLFSRSEMPLNSPEALYERGVDFYQREKYRKAIEVFQRLKEEYPLSKYALMAELGIGDSYFSDELFVEAESSYTEFINLHPTNANVPYAIFQLGTCHYKQMMSIDRDQTETVKARKEFERLISQFPSSKFAAAAEQKLRECKQQIAEHEFYVGYFYFKGKKYKAALKRFEILAKDYANLGLDYKVSYFITETKKRIDQEEKEKVAKEREEKEKEKNKQVKKQKEQEKITKKN
jgi:outer membrane protein assembly factor BamD